MVHRQWWFFQVCKQCADKNPSEVLPSLYTHCWASRRWTWPPLGWQSLITSVETCVYLEEKVSNLFTQVQPCTLHFISTRTTFVSFPFCHISSLLWKQNDWVCIRIFRLFDQSWSFMRRFGSNSSQRCSLELTESALSTGQFLSLELRGQAPLLKKNIPALQSPLYQTLHQAQSSQTCTVLLAITKPRLVQQIDWGESVIRRSREHVSTARESSVGVLQCFALDDVRLGCSSMETHSMKFGEL